MAARFKISFTEGGVGAFETILTGGLAKVAEKSLDKVSGDDNHGWYCNIIDTITELKVSCWGATKSEAQGKAIYEIKRKIEGFEDEQERERKHSEYKEKENANLLQKQIEQVRRTSNTSQGSSSENSGCSAIIARLIVGAIVVAVAIWLAVNIVLPIILLNSALACMILGLVFKRLRILFAILALLGGAYMLVDIINGWFSLNFVNTITKDTLWISIFVYLNTVAVGVSTGLLVRPLWLKAKKVESVDKSSSIILVVVSIVLILITTSSIPIIYHSVQNPLSIGIKYTNNDVVVPNQSNYSNNVSNNNNAPNTLNNNSSIPGKYPQASKRLLTSTDLQGLSKEELRIMRNEIFARYGYIFKTSDMKSYFSQQYWYHERYIDVSSQLTDIEHKNIALIKRYE